jgi:hypothetical protein
MPAKWRWTKPTEARGGSGAARRSGKSRLLPRSLRIIAPSKRRRQAATLNAPGPAYEKFVARFPHITTADQTKAIQDVLGDLASGHPMDRIICGDVGFGKTDVALRAAAAAVLSGKQVAIAVPTTSSPGSTSRLSRSGSGLSASRSEACRGQRRLRRSGLSKRDCEA